MRILLHGPANSIHTQRWFVSLCNRGHTVVLVSQHAPREFSVPENGRIEILSRHRPAGYFLNAMALQRVIRQFKPDILNTHYASGYGSTAALVRYRPTLLSVWGSDVFDFPYQSWLNGVLIRWNLRRADAIASTSHVMAKQVQRLVPDRKDDIFVTPFGVDTATFAPAVRTATNTFTIGTVKSLADKYGVDTLIHAFATLRSDTDIERAGLARELRLLIVGGGPQREALERLARALGVDTVTRFAGEVEYAAVPAWLNRLDIFVAASRLDSESFGVAVIEASACGVPVVVSDAGGLPEVVVEGQTGFIVERNRSDLVADRLKRLVLDRDLRHSLAIGGRQLVIERYDWSACVDKMLVCYERVIASCRK